MKPIATIFIVCIILFNAQHSFGEEQISAGIFFSQDEKDAVLKGGIITKSYLKYNKTVHTPNTDARIDIPLSQYTGEDLKGYEMLCTEKAFFHYELTGNSKLSLYNNLAAFSRLSGMRYYSRSEKKIIPFIINCYRIDSIKDKRHIADAIYGIIGPKIVNYFKTTDNRFGDLVFRSELYNEGDNFILKNVCVQPMEKYFISINREEEYRLITFFIYDKKAEGYFYYSVNAMRIYSNYFLKLGMLSAESFANRIRGGTVHMAKLLGLEWDGRIRAFE